MKKYLLFILFVLFAQLSIAEIIKKEGSGSENLAVYVINGHEYIKVWNGGIIHSESCECKKTVELVFVSEESESNFQKRVAQLTWQGFIPQGNIFIWGPSYAQPRYCLLMEKKGKAK